MMNDFNEKNTPISRENLDTLGKAWCGLIEGLSHDLVGYLATLRLKKNILQDMFPSLLKGYALAVEKALMESEIKPVYLKKANEVVNLDEQLTAVTEFLHLLNEYSEQLSSSSEATTFLSASACVSALLNNYPFEDDTQRRAVHFAKSQDVRFKGSPFFIEVLLTNLLANAIASLTSAGKGEITIWFSQEEYFNCIHIKDTGLGMSVGDCSQVFDRYFSRRPSGIMPGLGLCRLAMLQAGGTIICRSALGEYTHFIVMFPAFDA